MFSVGVVSPSKDNLGLMVFKILISSEVHLGFNYQI